MSLSWVEPDWPAPGGVRALCTVRSGGVSAAPYASLNLGDHVADAAAAVAENRRRLAAAAGLPAEPAWLRQVHGANVADLDGADCDAVAVGNAPMTADAAFTRRRGRVCAILTADCLPVLLAADSGDWVAAAHAGWRGLAAGVIEATVSALSAAAGAGALPPKRRLAWLGPAIGPKHFEVGAEVREALLAGDAGVGTAAGAGTGAEAAFTPNARGRFMADLGMLARRRLAVAGVDRIYGGGECTFADTTRFFSHRRDGVTGRQAALIWLE
jgi:polyphenol oxidase